LFIGREGDGVVAGKHAFADLYNLPSGGKNEIEMIIENMLSRS
jgi:hypothetical protein